MLRTMALKSNAERMMVVWLVNIQVNIIVGRHLNAIIQNLWIQAKCPTYVVAFVVGQKGIDFVKTLVPMASAAYTAENNQKLIGPWIYRAHLCACGSNSMTVPPGPTIPIKIMWYQHISIHEPCPEMRLPWRSAKTQVFWLSTTTWCANASTACPMVPEFRPTSVLPLNFCSLNDGPDGRRGVARKVVKSSDRLSSSVTDGRIGTSNFPTKALFTFHRIATDWWVCEISEHGTNENLTG